MTRHPGSENLTPTADSAAGRPSAHTSGRSSVLAEAARQLREPADGRWVEIVDRVVATAMSATRRSLPLRAVAPGGLVQVSEQVVIAKLRDRLDARLPDAAATDISFTVREDGLATGVLVQLVARYGNPLIPVADEARTITGEVLSELLGAAALAIDVQAMHVHFADVVTENPHS